MSWHRSTRSQVNWVRSVFVCRCAQSAPLHLRFGFDSSMVLNRMIFVSWILVEPLMYFCLVHFCLKTIRKWNKSDEDSIPMTLIIRNPLWKFRRETANLSLKGALKKTNIDDCRIKNKTPLAFWRVGVKIIDASGNVHSMLCWHCSRCTESLQKEHRTSKTCRLELL